ncbi:MAG: hypothetical protein RLY31_1201 [Bacteroidota bacterium]|jgi:hypothetical protein
MKKLSFALLLLLPMALFVGSCQQDGVLPTSDDLINTIAQSDTKQLLTSDQVPADITAFVTRSFDPIAMEAAWIVEKSGYEVAMEDGHLLYFNARRRFIGQNDGSRHARGARRCMYGDAVTADDLPATTQDYIAENYPDETIEFVTVKPNGAFGVKLSDGTVLLFKADGEFVRECGKPAGPGGPMGPGGGHPCACMHGDTVDVSVLPTAVTDYIAENYPDETIQTAVLKASGKFAVELGEGTVLLFDADGNFLKDCGVVDPNAGGYGPWNPPHGPGIGPGHHNGFGGVQITLDDLPTAAQEYLAENYAGIDIKRGVQKPNGFFVIKLDNGVFLLFDGDGNMLFDSGN